MGLTKTTISNLAGGFGITFPFFNPTAITLSGTITFDVKHDSNHPMFLSKVENSLTKRFFGFKSSSNSKAASKKVIAQNTFNGAKIDGNSILNSVSVNFNALDWLDNYITVTVVGFTVGNFFEILDLEPISDRIPTIIYNSGFPSVTFSYAFKSHSSPAISLGISASAKAFVGSYSALLSFVLNDEEFKAAVAFDPIIIGIVTIVNEKVISDKSLYEINFYFILILLDQLLGLILLLI